MHSFMTEQYGCWNQQLHRLCMKRVRVLTWNELDAEAQAQQRILPA